MLPQVIRLTREELHERVWSQPIRSVAAEFGISDVALAKACRKANVPVPARGFWAQKAAGKKVRAIPLPWLADTDRGAPRTVEFRPREKAEPLPAHVAELIDCEARPENRVRVSASLRRAHPLVTEAHDALKQGTVGRHDEYVRNWTSRHLDVDVSKSMLPRALRIMDAVVKGFEARGWKVSLGTGDDRNSYVTILGQRIPFGIREPRTRVSVPLDDRKGYGPDYNEEPSGRLALVLREYWGHSVHKSISETESRPLEQRLNDFAVAAIRLAHERVEWERQRAEMEERFQRERQAREEERRAREAEAHRIRLLEEEAELWHRSRRITAYVETVRAAAHTTGPHAFPRELGEWMRWADSYASSINPVERRLRELMSEAHRMK